MPAFFQLVTEGKAAVHEALKFGLINQSLLLVFVIDEALLIEIITKLAQGYFDVLEHLVNFFLSCAQVLRVVYDADHVFVDHVAGSRKFELLEFLLNT